MNPFKYKQLEEFTIEDCELYISRYPYGEHTIEVKRLLKELKKQQASQEKEDRATESKKPNRGTNDNAPTKDVSSNNSYPVVNTTYSSDTGSDTDWTKFFRILGTIAVIVIACVIVAAIVDGAVYTGPPIALVAFLVIRAIWKDS